jgi:hypothetical protein
MTTGLPRTGEAVERRVRAAMPVEGIDLMRELRAGGTTCHGEHYVYEWDRRETVERDLRHRRDDPRTHVTAAGAADATPDTGRSCQTTGLADERVSSPSRQYHLAVGEDDLRSRVVADGTSNGV